jgi:hypothetical protein
LEYVWKYDFRKNKRKEEFNDADYICAGFGTCFLYTGVERCFDERKDPVFGNSGEVETWEEKTSTTTSIFVRNFDIRRFYIDDRATKMSNAIDCIAHQYISKEEFEKLTQNNNLYKNTEHLEEIGINTENTFVVKEDNLNGKYIKLTHYWNLKKDMYCVIANDTVLVRNHPIMSTMNGKKALPFIVRVL